MRLVTFSDARGRRIGRLEGERVVDLADAAPELPRELAALLAAGPLALGRAATASGATLAFTGLRLEAPVPRPGKILAVGLNYHAHAAETGREPPAVPVIFNKQTTSVSGPFDPIHRPRASEALDYEGELGFVIGRRCRHVPRARAAEVIAGWVVVNDVSVRDWQARSPTMTMGKSFDTHCPFGPALVTPDEVADPLALRLRTWVNGELRQDASTKDLIFDPAALVEHLSTAFTLEPGDLVSTGTPAGVAVAMKPPRWLVPGDVVRVEIEGVGAIENRVLAEPPETASRGRRRGEAPRGRSLRS
jgi:2-keto-4-pentenoate hydratase/2-oxohepta-3-ene-1,7-dioic acid hydratase in catechol pathway